MDPAKRKLQMPPWHIPYLEKHRIYELFYELARELVIQQPIDHVLFLKQILFNAAKNRDTARVVLLASPKINLLEIARQVVQHTGQILITEESIMNCFPQTTNRYKVPPERIALCLSRLVRRENVYNSGWIMADCFRNAKEAKALIQLGILPTHVIYFIAPFDPPLKELLYCHVHEGWPEFRRTITALRDEFKDTLIEVHLRKRNLQEVVTEVLEMIKIRKTPVPLKPRILIIGPRGSGRKTQAKMLAKSLGLIHIDFEYLLCQAWVSQNELSKKLHSYKDDVGFHSELLAQVINSRILEDDCLASGYVLTNYPNTVTDFKYLDALDTPPNRVVFLECDLNICKERILPRRINAYSGSATNITDPDLIKGKLLKVHPKDKESMVDAELAFYCEQYGSLRSYCGSTACVVNADQPQRWVHECICAIIVRPQTGTQPRNPWIEVTRAPSESIISSTDSCGCCTQSVSAVKSKSTNI